MDFSSILKNETLRFFYSIIIPGIFTSFVLTLIISQILKNVPLLTSLNIEFKYIVIAIFIYLVFISGFIIEIIGVYVESKYIDPYVTKISCIDNKRFDFLWNKYLLINRKKTNDLILVDYYRSILTKMKFLINLPVASLCSYAIIIFSQTILKIEFFNLQTLDGFKGFVLLGFIVITISWFSYKRAKHCAKILFESRKDLMLYNKSTRKFLDRMYCPLNSWT
jgi:hypothetical protein